MFSFSKKLLLSFVVLIVLLSVVFCYGRTHYYNQAEQKAAQQATQLKHYIDAELARFSKIPQLLTYNNEVIDFLGAAQNNEKKINNYLADIQQASGASDIYILDEQGAVIASSNWQADHNFLGSDLSFRPYFKRAFAGEKVAYFALGMRTKERGIYFSQAIYNNNQAVGVVVLKVNVNKFESDRELLNTAKGSHFYVQLEDSVIAISDMENWRLNTFSTLDITHRRDIAQRRAYLDYQPKLIAHSNYTSQRLLFSTIDEHNYLSVEQKLRFLNASVTVLVNVSNANIAQLPALFGFVVIYALIISLGYVVLRRFVGVKKLVYSHHSVSQEISARTNAFKAQQDALVQSTKLATIGQLSMGFNHEINHPLNTINTYLASAKRLLAKGKFEALNENLQFIESLVARVHKIVAQLNYFSDSAKTIISEVPLSESVAKALEINKNQLKQDNISVLPPKIDSQLNVLADKAALEEVLVNLISNASQAMQGCITRELSISANYLNNSVQLCIEDTGPGIEVHDIDTIFEPFYSTKSVDGLGLGLCISKQIISALNGTLSAQNREQGGAKFIITLPCEPLTS